MRHLVLLLFCVMVSLGGPLLLTNDGGFYPFVVHEPEGNLTKPWPVLMFLHGRGCIADSNDWVNRAQWDGVGTILSQWNSGNRGEKQALVARQFLTIIPVARKTYNNQDTGPKWITGRLMEVINKVKGRYQVDMNRFYLTGYSMGAFGTWTVMVDVPSIIAAAVPSAGFPYTWPDLPAVKKVANVPIHQFCSEADTVIEFYKCKGTIDDIKRSGNNQSITTIYPKSQGVPHGVDGNQEQGMSHLPFQADVFKWLLTKRSGGRPNPPSTGSGGGGNKNQWEACSRSSECRSGLCCSKLYSGDGQYKCTPGSQQCI